LKHNSMEKRLPLPCLSTQSGNLGSTQVLNINQSRQIYFVQVFGQILSKKSRSSQTLALRGFRKSRPLSNPLTPKKFLVLFSSTGEVGPGGELCPLGMKTLHMSSPSLFKIF
jgi:hypothetical protein